MRDYGLESIEAINMTLGNHWTVVPPTGSRMRCPFEPPCDFHSLAPAAAVDNAPCAWRVEAPPAAAPLKLVAIALLVMVTAVASCGNVETSADVAGDVQRGEAGQVDQVDAGAGELGAPASCSPPFDGSSCSSCSSASTPLDGHCRSMLACVSSAWPCAPGADCWEVCRAAEGGNSQTAACVAAIAVCS